MKICQYIRRTANGERLTEKKICGLTEIQMRMDSKGLAEENIQPFITIEIDGGKNEKKFLAPSLLPLAVSR